MISIRARLLLLLFVAIVVALQCSDLLVTDVEASASNRVTRLAKLELRSGRLYESGAELPFTGIAVEYYSNRSLKSRSGVSRGRLHGLSEGWHTNGVLQVREHFQHGVSHGRRKKWAPDGNLVSATDIVRGKVSGGCWRWDPRGNLLEEMEMLDGQPHGVCRSFFPNGSINVRAEFSHGSLLHRENRGDGEQN
jgi:antitoxin component YwqK of YwqJK toxin-antitoxin module